MKKLSALILSILLLLIATGALATTLTDAQKLEFSDILWTEDDEPEDIEWPIIGDTIEVEPGLFLTINSARASSDGLFDADGVYLILDCTYENKSSEEAALSTLLNLSVKDVDGYKYSAALGADTKGSLDGALAPGDKTRGEVAFDVADGTAVEFFIYEPFLMGSQSMWRIALRVWAE